ncbi:hypothetical protein AB4072_00405 [Microvirga sp. 2MCAF38]
MTLRLLVVLLMASLVLAPAAWAMRDTTSIDSAASERLAGR